MITTTARWAINIARLLMLLAFLSLFGKDRMADQTWNVFHMVLHPADDFLHGIIRDSFTN